ncbi:hypothetical protein PPSIR1_02973 [Plesiocystis pacifica SIR-1]|uniref:Uncharacterized protein n=1 Tax=Plesiocystis pacifica SIR-1 TaxID=391625 RepID=A6G965_9BACT|nr:hypothetical protein [Plesiocystis pacifica]EDM77613.1 hypothetical protein PPSIR1_02973 [Plesiocystis pacifica SIR-1]
MAAALGLGGPLALPSQARAEGPAVQVPKSRQDAPGEQAAEPAPTPEEAETETEVETPAPKTEDAEPTPTPKATEPASAAETTPEEPAPSSDAAPAPNPASAPAPESGLPSYEAAVAPAPPADGESLPTLPGTGAGLFVLSGVLLGTSAMSFTATGFGVAQEWDTEVVAGTGVLGSLMLGASAIMLASGLKRNKKFKAWGEANPDLYEPSRKRGTGMLAGGITATALGGTATLWGGIMQGLQCYHAFDVCEPSPLPPVALGLGLASLTTGVTLLILADKRKNKYDEWRRGLDPARFQVVPTASASREGLSFGVAGRF